MVEAAAQLQPQSKILGIDDFRRIGVEGWNPHNRNLDLAALPEESRKKVANDPKYPLHLAILEKNLAGIRPDIKINPKEMALRFEGATAPFKNEWWFTSQAYPTQKAVIAWLKEYVEPTAQPQNPIVDNAKESAIITTQINDAMTKTEITTTTLVPKNADQFPEEQQRYFEQYKGNSEADKVYDLYKLLDRLGQPQQQGASEEDLSKLREEARKQYMALKKEGRIPEDQRELLMNLAQNSSPASQKTRPSSSSPKDAQNPAEIIHPQLLEKIKKAEEFKKALREVRSDMVYGKRDPDTGKRDPDRKVKPAGIQNYISYLETFRNQAERESQDLARKLYPSGYEAKLARPIPEVPPEPEPVQKATQPVSTEAIPAISPPAPTPTAESKIYLGKKVNEFPTRAEEAAKEAIVAPTPADATETPAPKSKSERLAEFMETPIEKMEGPRFMTIQFINDWFPHENGPDENYAMFDKIEQDRRNVTSAMMDKSDEQIKQYGNLSDDDMGNKLVELDVINLREIYNKWKKSGKLPIRVVPPAAEEAITPQAEHQGTHADVADPFGLKDNPNENLPPAPETADQKLTRLINADFSSEEQRKKAVEDAFSQITETDLHRFFIASKPEDAYRISSLVFDNIDTAPKGNRTTDQARMIWLERMGNCLNALGTQEKTPVPVQMRQVLTGKAPDNIYVSACREFSSEHPEEFAKLYKKLPRNSRSQVLLKENGLAPKTLLQRVFGRKIS